LDTTVFVRSFAHPGEEVPLLSVEEGPGGKGANAAVAAGRILGKGRVAFVGGIGEDKLEPLLRRSLLKEGVLSGGLLTLNGYPTGRAFVVVDSSGAKIIHTRFGANDGILPRHLKLEGSALVLGSSSAEVLMDTPTTVAIAAAKAAKAAGALIVYSPGVRATESFDRLARVLALADYLVVNRSELAKLTGSDSPTDGLRKVLERFPRLTAVVTLGSEGCVVAHGNSYTLVPPVDLSALGSRALNSTGSGDAFLAAYVCRLVEGDSPEESALWGNLAGALKASSTQTRGSPTRAQLESKMKAWLKVRLRPQG